MLTRLLPLGTAVVLISACSGTPEVQTGEDAEVIGGTLHRVDNTRADMAYVDPNADFGRYSNNHWGLNNSVTNRAEVQRTFNSWAIQINTSLSKVTGKE